MTKRITESAAITLFLKNDLKPLEPFINTMQPWKSQCLRCKKIVSPNYNKVRLRGHQCRYCAGNFVDEKDAIKLMKDRGFIPLVPYPGGNKPWKAKCKECQKITNPSYSTLRIGIGCKYCSHRAVDPIDAVKAMQLRGFKTIGPYPGSTMPWKIQCLKCKRKFETKLHSLKTIKGCKFCAKVAVDSRDVAETLARLNLKPLEPFIKATSPWKMKCLRCNRTLIQKYTYLSGGARNAGGCPYCSRVRVDMGEILKMMKKAKIQPVGPYKNGKTPWESECLKCGKKIFPRVTDMRAGQGGCVYCGGRKTDALDAIKLANKCGFTPIEKYPGANKGWLCRCNVCGNDSKPHYTSMQQSGSGCKFCKIGGFDFNKPAIVYLITHKKFGAYKIGVAGADEKNYRLKKHDKNGWVVYRKKKFETGLVAFNVEQKILKWFLLKELYPYVAPELMPQGGSSETVDASEIDLEDIWAKVLELSRVKR